MSDLMSRLPAVHYLLDHEALRGVPHAIKVKAIRSVFKDIRTELQSGKGMILDLKSLATKVAAKIRVDALPYHRELINATGITLHTNLGRSILPDKAVRAMKRAALAATNLEFDMATGGRGKRQFAIDTELKGVTGADAGTAVNNCAAATMLTLKALAAGKEVIVSRGQLVEIGGGFRIPEIMATSGAVLKEVGTTNITRIGDYEAAIAPKTALLMRVHTSNYRIAGHTESVSLEELVALGAKHNIPVVDDVGSGLMIDLGFGDEPNVIASVKAGADLVLFSGDKLLGGPQAGLIAGKKTLVEKIEKDPLMRAVRLDKVTLAGLEATLKLHRDPATVRQTIPTLRMLTTPLKELKARTEAFAARFASVGSMIKILDDVTYCGGGALPGVAIPTVVLGIMVANHSADELMTRLRRENVIARIHEGVVRIDLRTVLLRQEDALAEAIRACCVNQAPSAVCH